MPTPNPKEQHDDYINRCMSDQESLDSYPNEEQRYAVCEAKWSEAKMTSIAKYRKAFAVQRISFDYDEILTKPHGMELAQQWIAKGADVYIISARSSVEPMINRAKELGIPLSRVYATGSNKAKVEKIKELKISKHYDNNADVIADLGPIGVKLAESYTDYPQQATENAKIALRWAEENGWGSCGTPVGKARANQLAKGEAITEETISRMAGFERHRQNSQRELGDGCGRLMWLAWGGDEGVEWAQRKLKQIRGEK